MATTTYSPKSARGLYQIAKRHGVWDPEQIPVSDDRPQWEQLNTDQREQLLKACALFYEGEASVADTLGWWLLAMPDPERRMFLTAQLFEEVKHAEFFALYFREVLGDADTSAYLVLAYRGVLVDELRERGRAIGRALLAANGSRSEELERALVLGYAHYMGVIEGMMAVTGYDYFDEMLGSRGIFPRLLEGIRLIRADEGRHIAAGMDYLREKLLERPEYRELVADLFFKESQKLPARIDFVFDPNAFGLDRERMTAIAVAHLQQRSHEIGLV